MTVTILKKRKITIHYEDCDYIGDNGTETIEGYIYTNVHEGDGSRTIVIRTEPTHLHQCLMNLVDNSIPEK